MGPEEILRTIPETTRLFVDDRVAFLSYAKATDETITRKVEDLPAPEPEALYRYIQALGGIQKAGSWKDCHPLYVRADPATAKYPDGFSGKTI